MPQVLYFYVKDQYGNEFKVNKNDIDHLALFATTLECENEISESLGYAAALNDYYLKNDDQYKDSYTKLVSSNYGIMFLCTNISIALVQKHMKENGIDDKTIEYYKRLILDYKNQLSFNLDYFQSKKR